MGLKKLILHMVLWFFYQVARCLPIRQNRITFVTLTSQTLTGDFKLLDDALKQYPDIEIRYILTKFEKTVKGDLLYFLNCIKQVFVINMSRVVVINDNNYVISFFKRPQIKVLQVWHACGAVKKFGNEIDRQYEIKNYDYVLSTSEEWKQAYAKAFGVNEHQVLPLGIPRTDALFSKECRNAYRNEILERYPVLQGKYVVLYTPTFRGNIIKGLRHVELDLSSLIEKLPEQYVILYKMHPLLRDVSLGSGERILNVTDEELNHLYTITDCLITDYSSILFDFSIMEKKVILYTPDLADYGETLGFNIDLKSIPFPVCQSAKSLIEELNTKEYDKEAVKEFKNTYFQYQDGESTKRVSSFIYQLLKTNRD
ncbi:MAG: CDP-glycerol glycerophosphotransferase family protein [[Clostridium] innocuum]